MSNTKIIVVTCVKDEAWMLERFLATCSQFADNIIVSDESTGLDNSIEIYKKYPKVIVHHNPGSPIRGDIRRQFVFAEARKIICDKRFIIAIDSDEIISANILDSPEWQTVLNAEAGTLIHLQWVTLWKNYEYYRVDTPYLYGNFNRQIWVDDGTSEIPVVGYQEMHMAYNPLNAKKHIYLNDIVCLHYQCCNWKRMESKHRYYRAHEKCNIRKLSDLAIYRVYGDMLSEKNEIRTSPTKWFEGWKKMGIDMTSHEDIKFTHYDLSVMEMMNKHGADLFTFQDIWRVDWSSLANQARMAGWLPENFVFMKPRRRFLARFFHIYMRITIDIKFIRYIERKIFKKDFSYES
jgi:hypothetical protein